METHVVTEARAKNVHVCMSILCINIEVCVGDNMTGFNRGNQGKEKGRKIKRN